MWAAYCFLCFQKEESGLLRGKDEMESGSGSEHIEGVSGNEQENEQQPKKKRYHRHTARQIQEMEAYAPHLFVAYFFGKSCEERLLGFTTLTITTYLSSLSSLFKECPHPDDKQRMKLSQELGLKPRQVKFWFQNRRTQMKVRMLASRHLMIPTTFSIPFTFMVTLKLASYHGCTILEKYKR